MPNQLIVAGYATGQTVYAVIRRTSDLMVYNVSLSAYEAYSGSNLASYKVQLTEQDSSGFYAASIPSSANSGLLSVSYYGTADAFIGTENMYYDGALPTSAGTSLITLDEYKTFIRVDDTTYDNQRTALIAAASEFVENTCHSLFHSESKDELYNGQGSIWLQLYNAPASIQSITLNYNGFNPITLDGNSVGINGKLIYFPESSMTNWFPAGYQNVRVQYMTPSNVPQQVKLCTAELTLRMERRLADDGNLTSVKYEGAAMNRIFLDDKSYYDLVREMLAAYIVPVIA